jgi:hypothetical protein
MRVICRGITTALMDGVNRVNRRPAQLFARRQLSRSRPRLQFFTTSLAGKNRFEHPAFRNATAAPERFPGRE